MKPSSSIIARILLLAACWMALLVGAKAQAVSILHSFGDGSVTNDGATPESALVQGTDGNFYGTTLDGGVGSGCVFVTTPQGTVTILHVFGDGSVTNDGANPASRLIQAHDGNFYGTTSGGGSAGKGTVFKMTPQGALTILHSFGDGSVANDGSTPMSGLLQASDGNIYGTTSTGGSAGKGTVYEITLTGVVAILHSFGDGTVPHDGASPSVGLVQDAQGNFYGTTYYGGLTNQGSVYVINAQRQLSILYSFRPPAAISFAFSTAFSANGPGGYYPNSRLTLGSDGNLYGTTAASGYGFGVFFRITPQGQETVLHYFCDGTVPYDGKEDTQTPWFENVIIQAGDQNFYGMTTGGGSAGKGTIYKISPAGQVMILHSFGDGTVPNDGAAPESGVIQGTDGSFYGTTSAGGSAGMGAVFKLNQALPEIISGMDAFGAVGQDFSYQIIATNGPVTYSATGLPADLQLDSSTGVISGTPLAGGVTNATLTVSNSAGSASATLVIAILPPPVITSILSEFGSTAGAFSYQITAGGHPASFGATGLPAGLSVNSATGLIYGTPTATGTFSVTISATNIAGTDNETLTLVISSTAPTFSQEYVLLHSFGDGSVTNEGSYPGAMIQGPDTTFYGVTAQGGASGSGTIFNLSAAGNASDFSDLGGANGSTPQGLILALDGNFYGTTHDGGSANVGTLFKVSPAGVITLLHTFGDGTVTNDGANPQAGLVEGFDGNFYGTTQYGGSANLGTVFKMTPKGEVTILHSFGDGSVTNDGAQPVAALLQFGALFYGTTLSGGSAGDGTVFSISPGGTVAVLHSFGDGSVANDGQMPHSALTVSPFAQPPFSVGPTALGVISVSTGGTGGTDPTVSSTPPVLYGTTFVGGTLSKGTVFQMTLAGTVTILHNFDDGSVTNDGINPLAPVLVFQKTDSSPVTLFGTTQNGGAAGQGAVFELDSTNTLTILHSFGDGTVTNDGQTPMAGLCLGADGNLYGTTVGGGDGSGTVYAIVANLFPPPSAVPLWTCSGPLPPGMTFDPATGTIMGTPSAGDAVGAYTISITSPQNVTTTQTFTLTQTFAQWVTAMSVSGSASAAPHNDGIPNLLKYLCDIDPTTPANAADRAALPTMEIDTTTTPGTEYLALYYRQNAAMTGVTVMLQTSSDMQNWTTVSQPDVSQQTGTDSTTGDPIMEVGVKATGSKQFLRLNVTSP